MTPSNFDEKLCNTNSSENSNRVDLAIFWKMITLQLVTLPSEGKKWPIQRVFKEILLTHYDFVATVCMFGALDY